MSGIADYLLNAAAFVPHGYCLSWRPDLVAVHAGSDLLIAVAYFSIPLALVSFVRRRADLQFKWIFWMFACFITACGLTHVAALVTLWQPYYGMQGLIKVACAIVSIGTAVAIWPLIPHAIALPSPSQLKTANSHLRAEIAGRIEAQQALAQAVRELELRVSELAEANELLRNEVAERQRAEAQLRGGVCPARPARQQHPPRGNRMGAGSRVRNTATGASMVWPRANHIRLGGG